MKTPKIVENVSDYHDLYKGKRCFILGNGPSLNQTDLSLLKDEYTFGCNKISLLYEKRHWHPSFYVMVSSDIWRLDWLDAVRKSIDLDIPCFLRDVYINETIENFYQTARALDNVYFLNCEGARKGYPYPDSYWSYDISKKSTKWGTILLTCIQIATYMGFEEIYLLGCDLGFSKADQGEIVNFDPEYNPVNYDSNGDRHSYEAHVLAKRMTEKVGTKIFNATVGGSLEVYPRKNYSELFV